MNLTEHFTFEEMIASQAAQRKGIYNVPDAAAKQYLTKLCKNILEPLRNMVNAAIFVTSGYRSSSLNAVIGGAQNSQHTKGQAVDIVVQGLSVPEVVDIIRTSGLPFDQLIDEFSDSNNGWTHVSIAPAGSRPRGEVLKASFNDRGLVTYSRL